MTQPKPEGPYNSAAEAEIDVADPLPLFTAFDEANEGYAQICAAYASDRAPDAPDAARQAASTMSRIHHKIASSFAEGSTPERLHNDLARLFVHEQAKRSEKLTTILKQSALHRLVLRRQPMVPTNVHCINLADTTDPTPEEEEEQRENIVNIYSHAFAYAARRDTDSFFATVDTADGLVKITRCVLGASALGATFALGSKFFKRK